MYIKYYDSELQLIWLNGSSHPEEVSNFTGVLWWNCDEVEYMFSNDKPILSQYSMDCSQKSHGTCVETIKSLRWHCDHKKADHISCFNRHYAEHPGYWQETRFLQEVIWLDACWRPEDTCDAWTNRSLLLKSAFSDGRWDNILRLCYWQAIIHSSSWSKFWRFQVSLENQREPFAVSSILNILLVC